MTIQNKDTLEKALLMIASVRAALKNGVKHFNELGKPLTTEREILSALANEGQIVYDTNSRVQVTTDEAELEEVRKQFARHN